MKRILTVIVIDLAQPWTIEERLEEWLAVVREISSELNSDLSAESQIAAGAVLEDLCKQNNGDEIAFNPGFLTCVLVTGMENLGAILADHRKSAWCPYLLYHIRREAQNYGAGVIFTSVKSRCALEYANLAFLREYIMQVLHGFALSKTFPKQPPSLESPSGGRKI